MHLEILILDQFATYMLKTITITQPFLKLKFLTKSVNIENCLASSKMPKNQNKSWEDLKKYI